ncbi:MAG: hypothetical protein MR999_01770, partial [Flintibacter sp.]|uniref:hypothetical protein n=1 Tax=Flintibacter sp. TaxID=1918624 RepID=UPI002D808181
AHPVKNWSGTAHAAPLRLKLQYFPTKGLFCAVRTIWGTPFSRADFFCTLLPEVHSMELRAAHSRLKTSFSGGTHYGVLQ